MSCAPIERCSSTYAGRCPAGSMSRSGTGYPERRDPCGYSSDSKRTKGRTIGNRMINARAETVASKPAYRRAFAGHRTSLFTG